MAGPYAFFDDFRDSIWTKYSGNPVIRLEEGDGDYICEPNLIYEDGLFRMWFSMGCETTMEARLAGTVPEGLGPGLGYATSADGFTWVRHPHNPVLQMPEDTPFRPSVHKHDGRYYLFAARRQPGDGYGIGRWTSGDGLEWSEDGIVLRGETDCWEDGVLSNMAVLVDEDGTWRMLYTTESAQGWEPEKPVPAQQGHFGYAYSGDGLNWTKHDGNPVIRGFYGGDPCLLKIRGRYYSWHSEYMFDSLRIACRWSEDMVHWHSVPHNPDINYTQPWERGLPIEEGGTPMSFYSLLTDPTICEANGKVFMMYQGAQTPLGIATFDGTLEQLAARLHNPPLAKWRPSIFGMAEGGTLKITDSETDRTPVVAAVPDVNRDPYVLECRIRRYAGPTRRVCVIPRYANDHFFVRFWLYDDEHTFYQECAYMRGVFGPVIDLGPNHACDTDWHDWRIEVEGSVSRLSLDGKRIGECRTSPALLRKFAAAPVHIGFSCHDSYVSVDRVSVRSLA